MAPGISFKKQVYACLKENLELNLEFNEDTESLKIEVRFKGFSEPIVQEIVYLDHRHRRGDLDI